MAEEWQFCAVCGRPLEHVGRTDEWVHARVLLGTEPQDHVAVPVDRSAIHPVRRCDVCDGEPAVWAINAKDFTMPAPNDDQMSMGGWSFCDPCGQAMRQVLATRNITALVDRALQGPINPMTFLGVGYLRLLYAKLLINHIGDVVPEPGAEFDGTP